MTAWADDSVMMAPEQSPIVGKAAIKEVIRGWLADHCTSKHEPLHTETLARSPLIEVTRLANARRALLLRRASTLNISLSFGGSRTDGYAIGV